MDVGVPLSSDEAEEAATDEPVPPASAPTPEVEHLLREDPGLLPPNQFAELEVAHLGRAHVPRAEVADLLTKNTAKPVPPASAPTHTGLVEQRKLNPLGSNTKALARAGEQHQRVVTLYGGQKKSLEAAWKMFGISAKDLPVISMLSTEQAEQMIRAKGGL